jgi:hypothetical protein
LLQDGRGRLRERHGRMQVDDPHLPSAGLDRRREVRANGIGERVERRGTRASDAPPLHADGARPVFFMITPITRRV